MKRCWFIAATIAVFLAGPASAQAAWPDDIQDNGWQRILTNPDNSLVVLIQAAPASSGYQHLWTRWEYQNLYLEKYLSEQSLLEFDCPAQKFRMIQDIKFGGRNGSGQEIPSSTATDWNFAPAGSLFGDLIKRTCG